MRYPLKYILLTWVLAISAASATIINVPDDYNTIQAGIDTASAGDTVLVQPGTYVENVNFNGKNIVVGSLFFTTGDTTHISQTVIDGDRSGSVVTFENGEDSTAILIGFSIINGMNKRGGGIFCTESSPSLMDLRIMENIAEFGGGISCIYSSAKLMKVTITGNIASVKGGGIHCSESSDLYLSGITLKGNTATEKGGGIYSTVFSRSRFDPVHRCSIHSNNSPLGSDLYVFLREIESTTLTVILDTFSVMVPTDNYAFPGDVYTFDILNGIIEQVEADLYVSPDGNNSSSGLSSAEPLQTISFARSIILADSLHPHTIHLAEGLYSSSANGEVFPLGAISYVSFSGAARDGVTLNAEGQSSVMVVDRVRGVTIENMTVTGGSASMGGGIKCTYSHMNLVNTSVIGNTCNDNGGGIYIQDSNPTLTNVHIANNDARSGGGILCFDADPILENVWIGTNSASSAGGGISLSKSDPSFTNTTISGNSAEVAGGGIYLLADSSPNFDTENRSNIYLNHAQWGTDLFVKVSPFGTPITVVVDTFTVMYPSDYQAKPIDYFIFDILNAKIDQPEGNLYVSPEGSDVNSGQSPSESLKTVAYAQSIIHTNADNPATIQLAEGRYSPSTTGEVFPITMISHINLVGAPEDCSILDAEGCDGVVYLNDLSGVTIRNLTITGGLNGSGAGITCAHSDLDLVNVTLSGNRATYRGGGLSSDNSNLRLVNAILWNNPPEQIYFVSEYPDPPNSLVIAYSNIQGGEDSIIASSSYMVEWLESNIASDPLFADAATGDFHLQEGSPCVDAGTSLFIWEGDTLVNLPNSGYKGNAPDMGAYETPYTLRISEYAIIPAEFTLHQNYPNPFNPISTIRYDLPKASDVSLVVYDLLGREVVRLVDGHMEPGYYQVVWQGRDAAGREIPSGVYIARLVTPEYTKSIKMLLLR